MQGKEMVYGTINNNDRIKTEVIVKKCTDKDNVSCMPPQDLNKLISVLDIQLIFFNANFNPKGINDPVQYYGDTSLY